MPIDALLCETLCEHGTRSRTCGIAVAPPAHAPSQSGSSAPAPAPRRAVHACARRSRDTCRPPTCPRTTMCAGATGSPRSSHHVGRTRARQVQRARGLHRRQRARGLPRRQCHHTHAHAHAYACCAHGFSYSDTAHRRPPWEGRRGKLALGIRKRRAKPGGAAENGAACDCTAAGYLAPHTIRPPPSHHDLFWPSVQIASGSAERRRKRAAEAMLEPMEAEMTEATMTEATTDAEESEADAASTAGSTA